MTQVLNFQQILADDIKRCKKPELRATLMRVWCELEDQKRLLRRAAKERMAAMSSGSAPLPAPLQSHAGDFEETTPTSQAETEPKPADPPTSPQ